MEDGDITVLNKESIEIYNLEGERANREFVEIGINESEVSKGPYKHFMEKEIHEHPHAVGETFRQFIDYDKGTITISNINLNFDKISKIYLIACGTAYYLSLIHI